MVLSAMLAAVMCICAVVSVPVGAVPVSMAVFGMALTACVLGGKRAAVAMIVYILLGMAGFPVFSGFRGGFMTLAGPTGGYIISYIPAALFIGCFTENLPVGRAAAVAKLAMVSFAGVLICYVLGTVHFSLVTDTGFVQSAAVCVVPFAVFDILKCITAAMAAYQIRRMSKIR